MRSYLRHILIVGIILGAFCATPPQPVFADPAARALTREEIRSMPILARPNRFGHFYGNTVRRRYHRQHAAAAAPYFQQVSVSGSTSG